MPNIIFIFSDQHNPKFTGYEGHEAVKTPALDRLASEGVYFSNAYTPNPICVPARYCLLSGLYSRDTCVYRNSDVPRADLPSFAGLFSEEGWKTCLVGKAHFTGEDQFRGYRERLYGDIRGNGHQSDPYRGADPHLQGPGGGGNHPIGGGFKLAGPSGIPEFQLTENIITHEAVRFLQLHRERERGRPFFLSVHYPRPHFPYQPPSRWFDYYREWARGQLKPVSREAMRDRHAVDRMHWEHYLGYGASQDDLDRALAGYAGNVSYLDECVGHLLESIDHLGYSKDTVVLYSSDHGEMAGAHDLWHKQMFYEESARVPFIVRGPGFPRGIQCPSLASLVDCFPTICDLAGIAIPDHCAGESLLSSLEDPSRIREERCVFSEIAWRDGHVGTMVRKGPWKYCRFFIGEPVLFNLDEDPEETVNLAGNPEYASMRDELDSTLLEFWQPDQLEGRRIGLPQVSNKGAYPVAMQYGLPDGSWVDAWP